MTASTRIGWIRHGITEWNRLGKIQGVTDIPLSEEGIVQARLLAERLAKEEDRWDGVYCSDLLRAARTGGIIAEKLGIPLVMDARLRERSFGSAEGTTEEERLDRWGGDWRKLVPDQETDDAVIARGIAFVEHFVASHAGESWLFVTHGSFMARTMNALCTGLNDSHIRNMSLTVMESDGVAWTPLLYNCTLHLDGDASAE